jgi:hypothetical protein
MRASRERLRRQYLPARVRVLFIGESPPASGKFFYQGDSGLYRAMRDAFSAIHPSITDTDFLAAFQQMGCYLIDTSLEPVDRIDAPARRAACLAGEPLLCRTIRKVQPEIIVTIVRAIRGNAERAAKCAGWSGAMLDLPYPGRWIRHRETFVAKLVPLLRDLSLDRTIRECP